MAKRNTIYLQKNDTMRKLKKGVIYAYLLFAIGLAPSCKDDDEDNNKQDDEDSKKPNVLLVVVDDFGWGHLALNKDQYTEAECNSDLIANATSHQYTFQQALALAEKATPTLNSLAKNGVRFVDAYASSNVSSPSRAGLITAAYQERFGFYNLADGNKGLDESVTLMPKVMKDNGYATGSFGKVHYLPESAPGNMDFGISPLKAGFDYYFGFNYNSCPYYYTPALDILYRNDQKVGATDKYLTDQITEETIRFIDLYKDKPKMMYVAYNAVHEPLTQKAPEEYAKLFEGEPENLAVFYSYVYAFDQGIRKIMDKLETIGELENTIIIFMSDNGAAAPYEEEGMLLRSNSPLPNNGPLRGFKGESFNGGFKVPMIISWGEKIQGEKVCRSMVSTMDIFPTVFDAAQISMPRFQAVDGVSLMPIIGGDLAYKPHEELVWMIQQGDFFTLNPPVSTTVQEMQPSDAYGSFVVRRNNWALRYTHEYETDNPVPMEKYELYDLSTDKGQKADLSGKNKELVESMTKSFTQWYKDKKDPSGWKEEFWGWIKETFK